MVELANRNIGKRYGSYPDGSEGDATLKLEAKFVRLDGEGVRPGLDELSPMETRGAEGSTLIVFSDISKRKRAQESVAFNAMAPVSHLPNTIAAVDKDRRITYWNQLPHFKCMSVTADDATEHPVRPGLPGAHPAMM